MPKRGKRRAALQALAEKSVYTRSDPITGDAITVARKPTTIQTKPGVIKFRDCVKTKMQEFAATGGTRKKRAEQTREAFSAAASACKLTEGEKVPQVTKGGFSKKTGLKA